MTKGAGQTDVLFVSTSFPRDAGDWRGLFIRHLLGALSRRGELALHVWAPPGELPDGVAVASSEQEASWLATLMAEGGIAHKMRQARLSSLTAPLRLLRMLASAYRRQRGVDVYHVNWLQCALPLPPNGKPALISVLGNDLKLLRLPFMRSMLRRSMRGRRVTICPNAEWMRPVLADAFGDVAEIAVVSFGIDPCWYAVERTPDATPGQWLVVTRLTRAKLGPLLEWSEPFFSDGARQLHLFGPMQEDISLPGWIQYHGPATPSELCDHWFPRAQGLISLSQHSEGRPQVMLEAMASGLPIVASRIPAHADLVQDGRTGALCDSPGEFHDAIAQLESPERNAAAGGAAREWARANVGTWDDCAARYAHLYRHLLASAPDG